tara:strand:+ start:77929 stop:78519 length:591 start_codon:yes stop_codon:yes gene_type:complete
MTITELYTQLADRDFQDYETGNLFFPAYMYMYDPEKEYEIEAEILDIKNRLHRPNNYLDVMVLDIYESFISYLKTQRFGKTTKFEYYQLYESKDSKKVEEALLRDAYDERFFQYLNQLIQDHLEKAGDYEVAYVFLKGLGNAFPYIRAHRFISKFEEFIKGYKLIMFYPGEVKENFSLFKLLAEKNPYRAIKLINE